MRAMRVLAAVGLVACLASHARSAAADEGPGWIDVEIDGRSQRAEVVAVEGEPGRAARGDVVKLWGYLFTRGTEPTLRFRRDAGRLLQIDKAGRETVVAVVLRPLDEPEDDSGADERDSLRALSTADVAHVRGVRVFGEPTDVAAALSRVDLSNAAVLVESKVPERVVAGLPATVRHLSFESSSSPEGPADLASVARLTDLRSLALAHEFEGVTDLAPLGALPALRHLDLGMREVTGTEALRGLKSLRSLEATNCRGFDTLAPLAGLTRLESLHVGLNAIGDLTSVKGLPALTRLEALGTEVANLPADGFAALRSLNILCTPVPKAQVEAFRARHPGCEVVHDRREMLLAALQGVDRIRLRRHGPATPGTDPTVTELKDAKEVAALIAKIEFDEPEVGDSCCCMGNPHFEFYVGERLVTTLGMHHGIALRWHDGDWPADAPLSPRSQDGLCAWLTSVGVPGPGEELKGHQIARRRENHWRTRSAALLGPELTAAVRSAEEDRRDPVGAVLALLQERVPDRDARALLAFRLMGAASLQGQFASEAGRDALAGLDRSTVLAAATAALKEDEGALGVGVWLFTASTVTVEGVEALVRPAALHCLSDADPDVRALAMDGLAKYAGPTALSLLRGTLDGKVLPRAGTTGSEPGAETADNLQRACFDLLALGDLESLPRMRALAAAWSVQDREAFEKRVTEAQERTRK